MYAQAEDDFNRVETNYLNSMGRLAEAEGEKRDLPRPAHEAVHRSGRHEGAVRVEPRVAQDADERVGRRPELLPAHAPEGDATSHQAVRAVDGAHLQRGQHRRRHRAREPDAARGVLRQDTVRQLRPSAGRSGCRDERSRRGSNGIAIAPSNTSDRHALLLINPHTSFFFRAEAQMVSDEGLNAYGAVTWGQFFIYQGFNERAGWMHTSSGVDNIDEYLETSCKKGDALLLPVRQPKSGRCTSDARSPCRTRPPPGWRRRSSPSTARITGPIVREADGKWVSVRLMQEPVKALTQSYSRTKAKNYKAVPRDDGAAHELVEQHDLRRRRRAHRVLPLQLHSRSAIRSSTGPSRWTAAIPRPSGTACCRSTRRPGVLNPGERLALQHQQLAVVGRRSEQPEEGRLPGVRRARQREPARHPRHPRAGGQEGLHARLAHRRGVRQLPAGVRRR